MASPGGSAADMGDGRPGSLQLQLRQAIPIPLDATLTVALGEMVALVGPSGGGKSTILRCIAGLYRPASGKVTCRGETWLDTAAGIELPPQHRRVGLVFQHYALFPHMTARANIMAALRHLQRDARADRARELLALVGLEGLDDRRPAALSGGQQQRVALARALARDPAVLLLDEPFSAVDQVTRRRLQRELARLRRAVRIPILLVTHDLEEAAALADRVVVLHRGRTLQDGPPREVMSRPASAEVARLVDLRNIFEGEVIEHRPEADLTLLRWRGRTLEAHYQPAFAAGAPVAWLVSPGGIALHRRDRPSRGEHENPLPGIVNEIVILGDTAQVTLLVDGLADALLTFGVPTHVAARNRVNPGEPAMVSLLADGIHLMPPEELSGGH
jgi:molybdate transport system ATP-binding protein